MTTFMEYQKEERSLKRLKLAVDELSKDIVDGIPEEEYQERLRGLRELCSELFPDKLDLFDRIYVSRWKRLREQFPMREDYSR